MLYLDHRSRVVALAVEAVKPEDSALNYVRKCCEVLFELISQTVEEFASLQLMDSQHRPGNTMSTNWMVLGKQVRQRCFLEVAQAFCL